MIVKAGLFVDHGIPAPVKEVFEEERRPWFKVVGAAEGEKL